MHCKYIHEICYRNKMNVNIIRCWNSESEPPTVATVYRKGTFWPNVVPTRSLSRLKCLTAVTNPRSVIGEGLPAQFRLHARIYGTRGWRHHLQRGRRTERSQKWSSRGGQRRCHKGTNPINKIHPHSAHSSPVAPLLRPITTNISSRVVVSCLRFVSLETVIKMLLVFAAVGALVAWEVARIVYQLWFSPLKDIPGPFFAKISKLWLTY
jgi:hypothetical protein